MGIPIVVMVGRLTTSSPFLKTEKMIYRICNHYSGRTIGINPTITRNGTVSCELSFSERGIHPALFILLANDKCCFFQCFYLEYCMFGR